MAKQIMKTDGIKGFYAGLDSALLRQAVYCSGRMGLYYNFVSYFENKNQGKQLTIP